jgi:hypothetical protein
MNESPGNHKPVTELRQQFDRFVFEFKRFINAVINCFFALTREGTRRRAIMFIGLLLFVAFLFGLSGRGFSEWAGRIQNILLYLLNPVVAESFQTSPFQELLQTLKSIYFSATGIHYFLLFTLPVMVAWRLAAVYLTDIFELPNIRVAGNFILQASLFGGGARIRIREGEIAPEDENSPVYLIGGPGLVVVELDSAALFEQPDGRPYVVGPTVTEPFVLDGFERFRQGILLRDHRTDPLEVSSRSLDGIPVQSVGVNYLFSVDRGDDSAPTVERPYPFRGANTIESLVYGQTARVTPDGPRPADVSRSWFGTMMVLIRSALARFMSERNLTEYLANFGLPEIQIAQEQANAVVQAARRVMPPNRQIPPPPVDANPPPFVPRPDIKASLFSEFAAEFPALAEQRGVELHWVGIGSWKTPSEIIPEQHLEAWQLSMDNQARQKKPAPDLRAQYITQFIQDVPLGRFEDSRQKQRSHRETMISLLNGYREQFMKILNLIEKNRENGRDATTNSILAALRHINRILGWSEEFPAYWVGGTPPTPTGPDEMPSPGDGSGSGGTEGEAYPQRDYGTEEKRLFNQLMLRVRNIEVAIRLLEYERGLAPDASEAELILRAIQRWDRDNQ